MKGHGEKRSRKTEQFIAALLTEPTVEAAAKKAGIGDVTAWRWMNDRAFADQYREARREAMRPPGRHPLRKKNPLACAQAGEHRGCLPSDKSSTVRPRQKKKAGSSARKAAPAQSIPGLPDTPGVLSSFGSAG